ncbi:Zinc finger RING-type [Gracilaria domingensis]|nr:Zinc finger RING-type [Gracilaria domingensis]
MCSCLSFFSLRHHQKRNHSAAAASANAPSAPYNNPAYPPPPWQAAPRATAIPTHPNPNVQFAQMQNPYRVFRPSQSWNGTISYNQQAVPHFTISQPPRTAHPGPFYQSSSHSSSLSRNHNLTHSTSQLSDRVDTEDLFSFEAPEKEKQNPCPICLGPLGDEQVSTGQCLHLIHSSCLKGWLAKDLKSACPVCRIPYQDAAANALAEQPVEPPSTSVLSDVVTQS